MPDQFVQLPPEVAAATQRYDTINLIATIARFALPGRWPDGLVEHDLESRFAAGSTIDFIAASAWIASTGIATQPLISSDPDALHQALQQQNSAGSLQLLAINDASKLLELADDGTTRPLWSRAEPCLLLRVGFNSDQPYGYYSASLPGDSRRVVKLTWQSLLDAQVSQAVVILPPPKPIDLESVQSALHILEQALQAANQVHSHLQDLLAAAAPPTAS